MYEPRWSKIGSSKEIAGECIYMDRVKRIWYLLPIYCIRAVSPEPSLLAHTSSESRGTFRQKARSLAPLNGWACAVKICHDGMLEDTNSLDAAHMIIPAYTSIFDLFLKHTAETPAYLCIIR